MILNQLWILIIKYTKTPGSVAYYEVCDFRQYANWTDVFDLNQLCPYVYTDSDWICTENELSMTYKVYFNF